MPRTYTPGFSDALGNRRVAHGAPGDPVLEVLEFTRVLADAPGFERALRTRVDALRDVVPVSLAAVHGVERPEGLGLCLVTEHVPGRRLAELAPADLGSALALDLIRTVTPVLAALNQSGVGVAHGVLSASQVVVATDGRLIVVEHVLGWAVESLKFSRAQLHGLGIVVSGGLQVRFDGRTDMVQLGFLALSLWLRRPLDPADCPDKVSELLDEAAGQEESPEFATRMRVWLERAMQIGPSPFTSAHDAVDALDDLPAEFKAPDTESEAGLLAFHSESSQRRPPAAPADESGAFNVAQLRAAIEQRHATSETPAAPVSPILRPAMWILAVLTVIAIGEAVAVGLLVSERRAARATASANPPADSSPSSDQPSSTPTTGVGDSGDVTTPQPVGGRESNSSATTAGRGPSAASRQPGAGFGGLTIASALDVLVSADGTPIGSNGGPIALREGSHRVELVNEALGFRQTQTVNVTYGQMTVLRVPKPYARMSVNATPWAEVAIDGKDVGETPIANYLLPIGTHEIVFRHPELGERRQTVVVKVGEYVRVTQTFDRSPERSAK